MIDNEILRSGECEAVYPELSAYIDGELDERTVKLVKEHLEKCEKCRKLLSELTCLSDDISEATVSYPEDLHLRLMDALNEEIEKGRKKSKVKVLDFGKAMKKHGMWIGAGVAAVICLALVGSPIFRGSLEIGTNDAKEIAIEDAVMLQNGSLEMACEMSKTVCYKAEEAEAIKYYSSSLADNVEVPTMEVSDDMSATGCVDETETNKESVFFTENGYKLLPSYMLPRGELGWKKTESCH